MIFLCLLPFFLLVKMKMFSIYLQQKVWLGSYTFFLARYSLGVVKVGIGLALLLKIALILLPRYQMAGQNKQIIPIDSFQQAKREGRGLHWLVLGMSFSHLD